MLRSLALLSLLALGGCPRTGPSGSDPSLAIDRLVRRDLVFPPSRRTLEALEELRRLESGPAACHAATVRAGFLVDLFDFVRLFPRAGETPSPGHAELWSALGLAGPPARGPLATAQVLAGIERALRGAAAACGRRTSVLAEAAALLAADRRPRRTLDEMITVARDYGRIQGAFSSNAELRLQDWCAKAIRLAAGGDPAPQQLRINQCLLALWAADPHPYFDPSPTTRPTDPPWTTVAARLAEKRRALSARAGRLRGLVLALLADDARFLELAAPLLPTPLDLARVSLPRSAMGEPWDRTPVVLLNDRGALVGGRAVLADAEDSVLGLAIAARLHNDRRGRVCLAAPPSTPADRILSAARAARRAGATILELGVVRTVAPRAPDGDVQAAIFGRGRPVQRLETIPISLALYSTPNPIGHGRDRPLGLTFDREAAPNGLGVIFGRAGISGVSQDGTLPPRPKAELAELLATLRRAYPDDTSLMLGVESSLTLAEVIWAVEVMRRPTTGYLGVAIAASGMVSRGDRDLGPLLHTITALRIHASPAQRESVTAAFRRCYLDELRDTGAERPLSGDLDLLVGAKGVRARTGGLLRHKRLRACVEGALAKDEPAAGSRVRIRFSLDAAPR